MSSHSIFPITSSSSLLGLEDKNPEAIMQLTAAEWGLYLMICGYSSVGDALIEYAPGNAKGWALGDVPPESTG